MGVVVTRRWMIVLAVLLALLPGARASETAPPPPEAFFAAADIDRAVLSPSGRWLAMRTSQLGGRLSLVVFDLRDWGKVKVAARFADADIRDFEWVNDERLVFEIIDLKVGSGDQRYNAALFSVRHDGSELRQLIELRPEFFTDRSRVGRGPLPWNHGLLHVPGDGGDEVIVGRYQFNGAWEVTDVSPLRLNVVDGSTRNLAAGSPPGTMGWWFDAQGRPRVVRTRSEGRDRLYWRPKPDAVDWELLTDHERYSAPFVPRFFDARGDLFVTVSVGVLGRSVFPDLTAAESDGIFALLLGRFASPALATLLLTAGLAALMSTMDAQLLTLASMVSLDFRRPGATAGSPWPSTAW